MKSDNRDNSLKYWNNLFTSWDKENIKYDDWLDRFSKIIEKCSIPILDLGCGYGNNTLYLIEKGKQVIACDQSLNAIKNLQKNLPEVYQALCFNMLDGLPFKDNSFKIVIADLCLHYFTEQETIMIINEIKRVLMTNGHLMFRVNSINDTNHGAGQSPEIAHHLYETKDKRLKRFFDKDDIEYFFHDFDVEYLEEETMQSRYDLPKKLFRGCLKR